MKSGPASILCLLISLPLWAQDDMTKEIMVDGIRGNLAAFEPMARSTPETPVSIRLQLGETTARYQDQDKFVFDGIRITAPDDLKDRDFIWQLNMPRHWANWFVVPVSGEVEGGFKNWLNADKIYKKQDVAAEPDRMRVLQSLDGSYFKPGADYIFWFRRVAPGDANELRAVFHFAKKPKGAKEWDYESMEQALKLEDAPAEDQVKELGSRGGRILLDPSLFKPEEGRERINDVFFSLRQTKQLGDGFFITVEKSCPPCSTKPAMAQIREKYGPPDFTQTAAEKKRVAAHFGGDDSKKEEEAVTTHYYDYFAFEVAGTDADEKITGVRTQASDFSKLPPREDGDAYAQIGMKNLTVFYRNKKEVGRFYFFMEGEKEPLCIQEPPPGKYRDQSMELEYQGKGSWLLLTHWNNKVVRRIPYAKHRMDGIAEGTYANGNPSFRAVYKNGALEGELIEYTEEGEIRRKLQFKEGKPVKK